MHTLNISFFARKKKINKEGLLPITMRVTIDGGTFDQSINRFVNPVDWKLIENNQNPKKENLRELCRYMDTLRYTVYQAERKLIEREQRVTIKSIKKELSTSTEEVQYFSNAYEKHDEEFSKLVLIGEKSEATLEKYRRVWKFFLEFLEAEYGQKDIAIDELSLKTVDKFDIFLRSVRGIQNNTTVKYIRSLKKIVLYAIKLGMLDKDPFLGYKGRVKTIDRVFLTMQEINMIKQKRFSSERLGHVKDIFLFSCFTGLAYADVKSLDSNNIYKDDEGDLWLSINRTKTKVKANIMLLPPAIEILNKYEDNPICVINDKLLPVLSNQKMNEYLKEIAIICGITKHISYHTGRHSFATTIALANGISLEAVSSQLGHANITQTQHYAKMTNIRVKNEMKNIMGLF